MFTTDIVHTINQYHESLKWCRHIYMNAAQTVIRESPHLLDCSPQQFRELMDDLHRGLMIKLLVCIAGVDRVWTVHEEKLAGVLFHHLWNRRLDDEEVRDGIRYVENQARDLEWAQLLRPFCTISVLSDSAPELETMLVRTGNLIAKVDGRVSSLEQQELKTIQDTMLDLLQSNQAGGGLPIDTSQESRHAIYEMQATGDQVHQTLDEPGGAAKTESADGQTDAKSTSEPPVVAEVKKTLDETIAELDALIGLEQVKQEVRTLVNFLTIQRRREEAGLPKTNVSLHMVFAGNPGTGKTTVARILAHIYSAMDILEKGHLVETDRSGLVAEYAGQTATKANKTIDQALDGVLFIDEAYSLMSEHGQDAYGLEALQVLVKRMEDDRQRLVVILAGYPEEMQQLISVNPGLSSRLGRRIQFPDYSPLELAQIFGSMSRNNQYRLPSLARAKLLVALNHLYENRDRHFGNGRLVRNIFECAIRNLANRIVDAQEFTEELLTQFEPQDLLFPAVPPALLELDQLKHRRFRAQCEHCDSQPRVTPKYLGRRVKCKSCDQSFRIEWGEPIVQQQAAGDQ